MIQSMKVTTVLIAVIKLMTVVTGECVMMVVKKELEGPKCVRNNGGMGEDNVWVLCYHGVELRSIKYTVNADFPDKNG